MHDEGVMELMRGLRSQVEELVTAATPAEMRSMAIGLVRRSREVGRQQRLSQTHTDTGWGAPHSAGVV